MPRIALHQLEASLLQDISALATAFGVLVAVWQLYLSGKLERSQFEDGLNAQYRALLAELPLDALLGKKLDAEAVVAALPAFYRYFDLSNEQAFLHTKRRITKKTWQNWREGIQQNFGRPGFQAAWAELVPFLDGSFDELKAQIGSTSPPSTSSPAGYRATARNDDAAPLPQHR